MNWMYLVAGGLAAGGVVFHGVWGYLAVPARLEATGLPTSALGDGRESLWMLRMSWHVLTIVLAVMAFVLIDLGLDDTGATAAPRALAAMLALLCLVWIFGGGSRRRLLHPGLPVVSVAAILTLAGSV